MSSTLKIEQYGFGHMTIGGQPYEEDVIVFPDRVMAGWWRREGHSLGVEDLKDVFQFDPDVLVVGTGASGRMGIPEETRKAIEQQGIKLESHSTGKAAEVFNEYVEKKENVAGAFHLTC